MRLHPIALSVALIASVVAAQEKPKPTSNWPAFRGPLATGEAPKADPPTEWSEEKNIKWKVEIPGRGHATPIIWGDRVYIQTAIELKDSPPDPNPPKDAGPKPAPHDNQRPLPRKDRESSDKNDGGELPSFQPGDEPRQPGDRPPPDGQGRRRGPRGPGGPGGRGGMGPRPAPKNDFEFRVIALDRATGKTIWSTLVKKARPHEAGHNDASQVSNSPITDGEHIYAYFGSRGLHCLDRDGKVKWSVDLGEMKTRNGFGEGSSPALYKDTLVINWDHEGDDFIAAFDKKTGKEKWRVTRDEHTNWSTPLVVDVEGKPQVVVSATGAIRGYDLKTGKEIWQCKGMTESVIPSPMVAGDLLYAISGFRGAACLAIKFKSAKGDISDSDTVAWKYEKDTPYVPSALLMNHHLYFVENTKPMLTCLDAKSGTPIFKKQRISGPDSIYASILGAADHVYVVGRNGTTLVLKDGDSLNIEATNKLDDEFDASPAAAGNELFLRGNKSLYCLAEAGK